MRRRDFLARALAGFTALPLVGRWLDPPTDVFNLAVWVPTVTGDVKCILHLTDGANWTRTVFHDGTGRNLKMWDHALSAEEIRSHYKAAIDAL